MSYSREQLEKMGAVEDQCVAPSVSGLAAKVAEIERQQEAYEHLLGSIVATLCIGRNRETILKWEHGEAFLKIADGWIKRFDEIKGGQL